jgi:hypothetical protein
MHFAVQPLLQPFEQARLGRSEIDIGNAHSLKTDLETPAFDALRQRSSVNRVYDAHRANHEIEQRN